MTVSFSADYRAQWRDMDFNQHMANSAFLDYAGNTRMLFLDSVGFTAARFAEMMIGPVILEDRLMYQREIRLLEPFTVDVRLAAVTANARKFKIRNRFLRADGEQCAVVESSGLWFDLTERRPVVPPDALRDAWHSLARTDDCENWT